MYIFLISKKINFSGYPVLRGTSLLEAFLGCVSERGNQGLSEYEYKKKCVRNVEY